MPKTNIVLVKPKVDVSTAWVYKNYHKVQDSVIHPDNKAMRIFNKKIYKVFVKL